MNSLIKVIAVFSLIFTVSCAHQINITPPLNTLDADGISKIDKSVGYYISPDDLSKEVTTPGGGGDKVRYIPYKESEPALKKILSNIFTKVYSLPSVNDDQFISSNNTRAFSRYPSALTPSSSLYLLSNSSMRLPTSK